MKRSELKYPDFPDLFDDTTPPDRGQWYKDLFDSLVRYSRLAAEFGRGDDSARIIDDVRSRMTAAVEEFRSLTSDPEPDPDEPETLEEIRAARPAVTHRFHTDMPSDYRERLLGSILGRSAGCTLGAGLEFRSVVEMERWARYNGADYPLRDFWPKVKNPYRPRYIVGVSNELTGEGMDSVPVDDDTGYTLIGLLALEESGPGFTREDLARTWKRHMPLQAENGSWGCFWGERNFVQNLHRGVSPEEAGFLHNPNVQSVAGWTRADTWAYVAPGWPEKAAELAFMDASVNHRRNGVYGSMFFAAAISAGFVVDDPVEALRAGLNEIPRNSLFADAVRWCLEIGPGMKDFREGASAVWQRYPGMFLGHAINNACFVILGLIMGGRDFTRVIGETVAMGMDNDCTGATAGSLCGAVIGKDALPSHWYSKFNNRIRCYLKECADYIGIDELYDRLQVQAERIRKESK